MATVNFSVPDDVMNAFNKAFEGRNKSAVIADLTREAVDQQERLAARRRALRRIAAGHALAVWHRRTDQHAWLESFDRAGPAYGYKVDRWATIGEGRADGPAAIAVEIPSYSLGLADPAVVRIPLPEP